MCLVGAFVFYTNALASSLGITPTRVEISAQKPITTLTLSNQTDHAVVVHAQLKRWIKNKKKDIYTDSNDLIITPPMMMIEAGGSQLIRVGLRKAPHPSEVTTYRLFLTEQPPKSTPRSGGSRIIIVFRLNLPVFVAPLLPPTQNSNKVR